MQAIQNFWLPTRLLIQEHLPRKSCMKKSSATQKIIRIFRSKNYVISSICSAQAQMVSLYMLDFRTDFFYIAPQALDRFCLPGNEFHNMTKNLKNSYTKIIRFWKRNWMICSTQTGTHIIWSTAGWILTGTRLDQLPWLYRTWRSARADLSDRMHQWNW